MPSVFTLQTILDNLNNKCLECDGQTRLFHFLLSDMGIEHKMLMGQIQTQDGKMGFAPHFWIELETKDGQAIIDYKAQRWLGEGEDIPVGVFLKSDTPHAGGTAGAIRYSGSEIAEPPLPETVIRVLLLDEQETEQLFSKLESLAR